LKPAILNEIDLLEPTAWAIRRVVRVARAQSAALSQGGLDANICPDRCDGARYIYDALLFEMGCWRRDPAYVDLLYTFERELLQRRVSLQLGVRISSLPVSRRIKIVPLRD
jgi:hypothetical protein